MNHLFLKDTYDQTGYYEYSSFQNYAYLGDNSDFTVYEQIGTPRTGSQSKIISIIVVILCRIMRLLPASFPVIQICLMRTETHYRLQIRDTVKNYIRLRGKNNFYFGMYLEANFLQMPNGKVEHKGKKAL